MGESRPRATAQLFLVSKVAKTFLSWARMTEHGRPAPFVLAETSEVLNFKLHPFIKIAIEIIHLESVFHRDTEKHSKVLHVEF